jgi:membrane-bound lytic murein transglycosylase F
LATVAVLATIATLTPLFSDCTGPKVGQGRGPLRADHEEEPIHNAYTGSVLTWPLPRPVISRWDAVIRHAADEKGYDWRFISAIVRAESEFNPNAVSHAGAVGLMQVMPAVARDWGISREELFNPLINVEIGVGVLDRISQTLRFPAGIATGDRCSIILASYNSGIGHVLDARRLAIKYGENYNSWAVVSKYLSLKSEMVFYEDEAASSGRFRGSAETIAYVARVMQFYDEYSKLVEQ